VSVFAVINNILILWFILIRFDQFQLMYWVCALLKLFHIGSNFELLSWFQSHNSFVETRFCCCFSTNNIVYSLFSNSFFPQHFVASQIIIINWQRANNCKMDLLLRAKQVVFLLLLPWRHTRASDPQFAPIYSYMWALVNNVNNDCGQ